MKSNEEVDVPVYLQVEPQYWRNYDLDNISSIKGAKVVGTTQKKSASPRSGTVEVKITLRIPKAAFVPLRPEAVVVIPETMTDPHPVEVVAEDPQ